MYIVPTITPSNPCTHRALSNRPRRRPALSYIYIYIYVYIHFLYSYIYTYTHIDIYSVNHHPILPFFPTYRARSNRPRHKPALSCCLYAAASSRARARASSFSTGKIRVSCTQERVNPNPDVGLSLTLTLSTCLPTYSVYS